MIELYLRFPNIKKEFEEKVLEEIKKLYNKKIILITNKIKRRIQSRVLDLLKQSETYQEIIRGGILVGEIGLQDQSAIDRIVNYIANNIVVEATDNSGGIGSISIAFIHNNYEDLFNLEDAVYYYTNAEGETIQIDWLRWFILYGSDIIVFDYDFFPLREGRTGLGIMRRSRMGWSLPPEHAGTPEDNFITRALIDLDIELDNIIRQEMTNGLQ